MRKLEDYVINGDGTGGNPIVGLLNTAGIGARVHATAPFGNSLGTTGDNLFDTIRYAIADLTLKFYRPDIISYNAILSAKFDTAKDAEGRYIMSYDPVVKRMWNLRVVEAGGTLIPTGTRWCWIRRNPARCLIVGRGAWILAGSTISSSRISSVFAARDALRSLLNTLKVSRKSPGCKFSFLVTVATPAAVD